MESVGVILHLTFFSPSVVFWLGDLNFRIEDLEMQVVKSAIDNNKYSSLWEKDQVEIRPPSNTACTTCIRISFNQLIAAIFKKQHIYHEGLSLIFHK